jgi:NADH-quinone oxidoreductase subunit N
MTIGNVAAVLQNNVKRMLAYSSVAHAGYVLIGVAAMLKEGAVVTGAPSSVASVIYYLVAYTIMNVGAFGFLLCMRRQGEYCDELSDFSGLGKRRPALAGVMFLFLLALAGIPPTIGFFGKFYIFMAAIRAGLYWLAAAGVVNVVISLFYYARVVVYMYMRSREREVVDVSSLPLNIALIVSAAATVVLGIFPQSILAVIERSSSSILTGGFIQ